MYTSMLLRLEMMTFADVARSSSSTQKARDFLNIPIAEHISHISPYLGISYTEYNLAQVPEDSGHVISKVHKYPVVVRMFARAIFHDGSYVNDFLNPAPCSSSNVFLSQVHIRRGVQKCISSHSIEVIFPAYPRSSLILQDSGL